MHEIQLASGHGMPVLGLGTWDLRGKQCTEVVLRAIELGYTHIDTAWMYENQEPIGRAVRQCGVDRSELFITSKIWHTHLGYDEVLKQFGEILDQLQMDYVDLLLIHWPSKKSDPLQDTLRAFEKISAAGKTRSIGVSNFDVELVERARASCQVPICVNQVEYYTHLAQQELLQHCIRHSLVLTAYRPLGKGGDSTRSSAAESGAKPRQNRCPGGAEMAAPAGHNRRPQGQFRSASAAEYGSLRLGAGGCGNAANRRLVRLNLH